MRQTAHSLVMHELAIIDERGLVVLGPTLERLEDVGLPQPVVRRIVSAREEKEREVP